MTKLLRCLCLSAVKLRVDDSRMIRAALCILFTVSAVSAIDTRMCMRNCRQNDHYCRYTGAPGQTHNFCMQKDNECKVGCIQMCKMKCSSKFTTDSCVEECQYRGKMMLQMGMAFIGKDCMDECMWMANQCNRRCDDAFYRNKMQKPLMEYIYPEQQAEDWTVGTGLMDNPNREGYQNIMEGLPDFKQIVAQGGPRRSYRRRYY